LSRTRNDILISAFLVLLLVWVVWEARSWPFRTRLFPWAIGFPVLALAMIQFGLACWKAIRERSYADAVHTHGEPVEKADAGRSGHQARLERVAAGVKSKAEIDTGTIFGDVPVEQLLPGFTNTTLPNVFKLPPAHFLRQ